MVIQCISVHLEGIVTGTGTVVSPTRAALRAALFLFDVCIVSIPHRLQKVSDVFLVCIDRCRLCSRRVDASVHQQAQSTGGFAATGCNGHRKVLPRHETKCTLVAQRLGNWASVQYVLHRHHILYTTTLALPTTDFGQVPPPTQRPNCSATMVPAAGASRGR
jgi:hypothetical protein